MTRELNEVELWKRRKQREKYISILQGVIVLIALLILIAAAIHYKLL